MAKRRKGNKIIGRFVALEHHLLNGFKENGISPSAILTYILLKKNHNPLMHGPTVILTYSEGEEWMSSKTFSRALKELEQNGFIEKVHHGGLALGRDLKRSANVYKFSNRYREKGTPPRHST